MTRPWGRNDFWKTKRAALGIAAIFFLLGGRVSAANPDYQVSENGRYLLDPNGAPFFWQADTEWELLYALSTTDAQDLLRARKAQGFTVVQAMCDGLFPSWIPENVRLPAAELMPWMHDDPRAPNEAFFQRMDQIVAAARENAQLLLLGVYHVEDVQNKRITLENVGDWTRWLAHRYRDQPNIIWTMYSPLDPSGFAMVRAAIKGLREGDGGSHLITLHPEGTAGSSSAVQTDLSFHCFQSLSSGRPNCDYARSDRARRPAKPVINVEARYEAEQGVTAWEVRRSAWFSYLAGAGFSYGHIENWKSPAAWRDWLESPGARQVEVAGRFFRSLAWSKLVPDDQSLIDSGEAVAARSEDGAWFLAYLPSRGSITVKRNALAAGGKVVFSWVNPKRLEKTKAGSFSTSAPATFTPPAEWEDAVLFATRTPPE